VIDDQTETLQAIGTSFARPLSKHLISLSSLPAIPHRHPRIVTKRHQPSQPVSVLPILAGSVLFARSIPAVRTELDVTGRSHSVPQQPFHSLGYPSDRRNTLAAVTTANVTAPPPSAHLSFRNRIESTAPFVIRQAPSSERKDGMSKVVRSVKNVTKGYSTVQVKVRNCRLDTSSQSGRDADSFCSHFE
jgi:hypothetical protein